VGGESDSSGRVVVARSMAEEGGMGRSVPMSLTRDTLTDDGDSVTMLGKPNDDMRCKDLKGVGRGWLCMAAGRAER